jgi:hypothetical protein
MALAVSKEKFMNQVLKDIIKKTALYVPLRNWRNLTRQKNELIRWEKDGRPAPPPHLIKQQTLRNIAEKFELEVLVETGTYYGDMVEAMKTHFSQIYSIELSEELYEKAKKRFDGAENVTIIHGDSGVELGKLTGIIKKPALFWLDGHYSAGVTVRGDKDTPIFEELTHIFNANLRKYVIIIDDARCFGNNPAYPSIEELNDFIKTNRPDAEIEVKDDSIRIIPSRENG